MTDVQQRASAKEFAAYWKNRGDEKQETQRFWIDLLRNVYGVPNPEQSIEFEVPVKLSHTSFIDGYLADTRVLIEQKGADIDLKKGYKQSDGQMLTPYQQARRYAGYLPFNKTPRWIVVCNFQTFRFLYKGIIINHNKKPSQPTLKRRFFKKKAAFFHGPVWERSGADFILKRKGEFF